MSARSAAKSRRRPARARPAANALPEPIVADHHLLRRIGRGSYGEVWLAQNVMGSCRAVKVVYRESFEDNRPFQREFAGLQRFEPISRTHPGFVSILQVGRNDEVGYFYCVMELADDASAQTTFSPRRYQPRTLASEMAEHGLLPWELCLNVGLSLTAALGHLHRHGLVHRDVKPSNIVFVSGTPRLADIGLVTTIGEPQTALGTEGYIPPEGPGTPLADLYSLGMVLYQVATGKSLQDFPNLPTRLRECPNFPQLQRLNEVILRATDRNPRQRYATAEQMHEALAACHTQPAAKNSLVQPPPGHGRPHAAPLKAERKQVTSLCLDASWGPMADPEDARRWMERICELGEKEVARFGGTVIQVQSTGILSVFGAPLAYEDHARRAVYASLAIQRAAAMAMDEIRKESGISLEVRCGLDSSLTVIAVDATGQAPASVTGDSVQAAARVARAASAGQVVITEATWKAAGDAFMTRSLGEQRLPGWTTLTTLYEVTGQLDAPLSLEGAGGKRLSPFVGRSRELSLLHDRFAEVASGQGQVVLWAGEPGIGKSRLLLEFRRSLADRDITWLTGRSVSFGRDIALLPIIHMLKQFLAIQPGDDAAEMAAKVDQLDSRTPADLAWTKPFLKLLLGARGSELATARLDARFRKTKTFEALRAVFWQRSQRHPVVLAIEDLHWVDPASEEFLTYLADSVPRARVLLVANYRPGYENPFPDRSYVTRASLSRLSEGDSVQMAQAMLGTNIFPNELRKLVSGRAEGNPFFVEELVKSLLETGALRTERDHFVLTDNLAGIQAPNTVQNVLMSRIDRLPAAAKKALQLASVIGREFSSALLETIADTDDPLPESLQQLKNAELIYERPLLPETTYVFKHALTQEVAYSSLLIQRRKELHRLVAASIDELYSDRLPEFYGTLAYHYQLGEEWQRALDYLVRAADNAQRVGGYHEQAELLTQSVAVATRLGQHAIIPELRARRGTAYARSGLWAKARPDLEAALRELPDESREHRAELLAELAGVCFWALDIPGMERYAREGFDLAEQTGRSELAAGIMGWLAAADQSAGNLAAATEGFERALAKGHGFQSSSLANYPLALYLSGRIREAIDRGRQSAEMCANLSDHLAAAFGAPHLALALAAAGRYAEALHTFKEALELATKHQIWPFHARAMAMSAGLHLDIFDYAGHQALAEEARERARSIAWQPPLVSAGLDLIFNFARRQKVALAEKLLPETAREIVATGGWHRWLWELRLAQARAELALAREDWPAALRYADDSIAQSSARARVKYHVAGLVTRARALAASGRDHEAIADLRRALALAQPIGDPAMLLRVCSPLLKLDGSDTLASEARHASQRILEALPPGPMQQRFLAAPEMQPFAAQLAVPGFQTTL